MHKEGKHRPAMEIRVAGLSDGEYPFAFDVPAAEIGLDESFIGNVKVEGELRKVSTQLVVRGSIQASYVRNCDRCLAEIHRDVDLPLNLYYHAGPAERKGGDGEKDEVITINPDQDAVVLDDEVRQAILLDLPLKMLCSDDCKGICSGCGADLNREECRCEDPEIDPRWSKLADIFKKQDEN